MLLLWYFTRRGKASAKQARAHAAQRASLQILSDTANQSPPNQRSPSPTKTEPEIQESPPTKPIAGVSPKYPYSHPANTPPGVHTPHHLCLSPMRPWSIHRTTLHPSVNTPIVPTILEAIQALGIRHHKVMHPTVEDIRYEMPMGI